MPFGQNVLLSYGRIPGFSKALINARPDYQMLMLPLLKVAGDRQEHRTSDVADRLARDFKLTEDERQQLLPSGKQTTFTNRIAWAKTYLVQAGLLEATKRAHFTITERGRKVLAETPASIDNEYLSQFPEFVQFRERSHLSGKPVSSDAAQIRAAPVATQTPDELLLSTVKEIEAVLARELLNRVLKAPPTFFERLIIKLLITMGYGGSQDNSGRIVGQPGDGGIDGVIDQDALGLDQVYVQAKRYAIENAVSEPEIRAFSGSLGAAKANKGVFVTTSYFTQPARSFAERHPSRIVLIDGEHLATLMISHNVGVQIDETLYLKKVDEDFFLDE
jgi:restriction system protein